MHKLLHIIHLWICVQTIPLKDVDLGNCGRMNITFEYFANHPEENFDYEEEHSRIIGGFNAPEPVPWFSLLKINSHNGTFPGHQCGGALITSK